MIMRKKTNNLIFPLLLMGVFLIFASSCQKDDDDNGNGNNTGIPVLSTTAITDITQTTAKSGGNITSDGGAPITVHGVCWSTNENPTIDDNKTEDGTGAGSFTSSVTGLEPNTTYYLRAYATNSAGTSYGSIMSFTTQARFPVLSTREVTDITENSATSGGNITDDGGVLITAHGVCWSTNENPTIDDNKTEDGTGAGSFTSSVTGLEPNTTYYLRAYATNSAGTSYGSIMSFTTQEGSSGSTFTDPRDGKVYQTVVIGNQEWMAENLAYLPSVNMVADGSENAAGSYYYYVYGYDGTNVADAKATDNYATYGVLYNWTAAMDGEASSTTNPSGIQGVCPAGWHLPSEAEWDELTNYLGGTGVAGGKLKETGTTHWNTPNTGATNETGFTALPGGNRSSNGSFGSIGYAGHWWSATEYSAASAWYRLMYGNNGSVSRNIYGKEVGFSVRCVRD
jgi:uncharacterized protein (TIGR02145 family)